MKVLVALAAVFLVLAPVACGGGDGDSTEAEIEARVEEILAEPKIHRPPGPEPKRVIVEDLKIGSGPVADRGDRVAIHYIADAFRTGDEFSRRWEPNPPVVYPRLGEGAFTKLEKGIEGMREGGRRTVIAPEYVGVGAVIYIVDLEKVEPAPGKGASSGSRN